MKKDKEKRRMPDGVIIGLAFLSIILIGALFCSGYVFLNAGKVKTTSTEVTTKYPKPASYRYEFEDFVYTIDKVTIEEDVVVPKCQIVGYNGKKKDINIPKQIDGKDVYKIGNAAFYQNKDIKTLNIPSTVTEIDNFAFCRCSSLEKVNFEYDHQALSIGHSAFYRCIQLQSLDFSKFSKLNIGSNAFASCVRLTDLSFNNSCYLHVDVCGFRLTGLKKVDIPKMTVEIKNMAFGDCYDLKEFNVPDFCHAKISESATTKTRRLFYRDSTKETETETVTENTLTSNLKSTETATETTTETTTKAAAQETTTRRKSLVRRVVDRILNRNTKEQTTVHTAAVPEEPVTEIYTDPVTETEPVTEVLSTTEYTFEYGNMYSG